MIDDIHRGFRLGELARITRLALPWRFQLVGQHERQFCTLKGNPLVHRVRPGDRPVADELVDEPVDVGA